MVILGYYLMYYLDYIYLVEFVEAVVNLVILIICHIIHESLFIVGGETLDRHTGSQWLRENIPSLCS